MAHRLITPDITGYAATLYLAGWCLEEISREIGFSRGGIKKRLVEIDIPIETARRKRDNAGIFPKGNKPWNAGTKGAQVAWNKGLNKENTPVLATMGFQKGDKCVNWKGGVSTANQIIRKSWEHRHWSRKVLERDDFTCQICNERGGSLNANHIKKFSDYPDLRFELSNGITLCRDCHYGKVNHHELEWELYFTDKLSIKEKELI